MCICMWYPIKVVSVYMYANLTMHMRDLSTSKIDLIVAMA